MSRTAGTWIRIADGLTVPVPTSHEATVSAEPAFFGVRGRPATSFLRAALDAGWLRARAYPGEIVFEHAQPTRAAILPRILCTLLRRKTPPRVRIIVNSARQPHDPFSTTTAELLAEDTLAAILNDTPSTARKILERARAEAAQEAAGEK